MLSARRILMTPRALITVLSLGGTISSAPVGGVGPAKPALSAGDLVAAVPDRKRHTSSVAAFGAPGVGPLGWIAEGQPRLRDRPYPRVLVELPPHAPVIRPPLVKITMDDDGWWLPAVRDSGAPGLVIEG